MINILIVEDSDYKLTRINTLLQDDLMIKSEFIDFAKDIKSAKKLLINKFYDLLILDLVLPLEEGDDATPENGVSFLKDIYSNPNLNPPIHIIGLTEFEELKPRFDSEFNDNLWHLVNYNASQSNWQDRLKNLISHLLSTKNSFFEKHKKNISCDVAIIAALNEPEFEYVLQMSPQWNNIEVPGDATKYYVTEFTKKDRPFKVIAACTNQMGMTATADLATKICMNFMPKYIFMSGICAGIRDRGLNYGDIIIAEQSWDYGSGKMKQSQSGDDYMQDIVFEPDPRPIQLCPELKAKINSFLRKPEMLIKIQKDWKSAKPKSILQAKLGPVASGSYVISSESILNDIKSRQRKLLGIEMEAYGLYYSAENSPNQYCKAMMVKSVSDFGDSLKDDSYQEYAAFTSAQFLYNFICEEILPN